MTEKELSELNAWIAEHVMGWVLSKTGRGSIIATRDLNGPTECDFIIIANHPWDYPDFSPSTDPAAAMQVLEKVCSDADCKDVGIGYCDGMEHWGGNWYAFIIYRENPTHRGSNDRVNAETLPLAICLFAKKLYSNEAR